MTFFNLTLPNSHPSPLPRFKANSSHSEHWCLTGELGQSQITFTTSCKDKSSAFYCFMIHLQQVMIWSSHIKDMIWSVIPSDTELISSCPISASRSFSLKKLPWSWRPPTALFSHLWCYSNQSIKNCEALQPPWEGSCTKDHPKPCFLQSRRSNSCLLETRVLGQAA